MTGEVPLDTRKTKRSPAQWLRDLFRSKFKKQRSDTLHVNTPRTPPLPPVQPVSPNSGLTDDEKDMIYRATRRDGVWYMCAKRHPYLVTECGTPVQMATCPTCGSVIGGKHHKFIGAYHTGSSFFTRKGVVSVFEGDEMLSRSCQAEGFVGINVSATIPSKSLYDKQLFAPTNREKLRQSPTAFAAKAVVVGAIDHSSAPVQLALPLYAYTRQIVSMGRKGGRGLSTLVRAEEAAEEEILETPALSSFAEGGHSDDGSDSDDEEEDEEAELERRLVEEQLREEQEASNQAQNKGIYNREALVAIVAEWNQEKNLAWVETLDTCEFPLELENVHDDLKREVAFYNQTLASVRFARDRLKRENIAYKRPEDYFAEMLKSDAHMAKVKDKLIYEQKKITAVEERKKSQAHRKVAKEIQAEKLKQRAQQKNETLDAVKQWKKRKNSDKNGLIDDKNDEQLESIVNENNNNKRKRDDSGSNFKGNDSKKPRANHVRESKDKKFGFGGKKRFAKRNDKESTNDFSQFPGARKGGKPSGGAPRGGPRGGKPAAAVRASAAKNSKATPKGGKRAGKEKRTNQRTKGRR